MKNVERGTKVVVRTDGKYDGHTGTVTDQPNQYGDCHVDLDDEPGAMLISTSALKPAE